MRAFEELDDDALFWLENTYMRGAIDPSAPRSRSRTIDGTDFESCGAFKGEVAVEDLDGEGPVEDDDAAPSKPAPSKAHRARILGYDDAGRKIYTADPDARAGYRTATDSRSGETYIGYEPHIGVQIRDVRSTNHIDKVRFGPEVPSFITSFNLAPAGSHRAQRAMKMVELEARESNVKHVVVDRGYSQSVGEYWAYPLAGLDVDQTFILMKWQRGLKPLESPDKLLDGHPFSNHVPDEFIGLPDGKGTGFTNFPLPGRNDTAEVRQQKREPFNSRGPYRLVPHSRWDTEGYRTFKCPFCVERLFARDNDKKPRPNNGLPTALREGFAQCCPKRKTHQSFSVRDIPNWQPYVFGSTAHGAVYGLRSANEKVNGELKGSLCNLGRSFMRVFTTRKRAFLLMFTFAAYNVECWRSFQAKQVEKKRIEKKERAKRRTKTVTVPKTVPSVLPAAPSASSEPQTPDGEPPP